MKHDNHLELNRLMNAEEVAAILNISPSYVLFLVENKEIACVRIGGFISFRSDDLQKYIQRVQTI